MNTEHNLTKTSNITPEIELYIERKANKARNEAIGILGFIALILSILTALGAYQGAKSFANEKFAQSGVTDFVSKAKIATEQIYVDQEKARKLVNDIQVQKMKYEKELSKLESLSLSHDRLRLECQTIDAAGQDAFCPQGFLVTGCSAGHNKGSITHNDTSCHTQEVVDWTQARCCRVFK